MQVEDAERAGVTDPRVLHALQAVDRSAFVPAGTAVDCDAPIDIGGGQTTSQPSLMALTLQHLALEGHEQALDVGSGSGYGTALLAHLAADVIGLEVRPDLARAAADRLVRLGLANARVIVGDGWAGWPDGAPYDAITVGAEAPSVPAALLAQLADGGRLVMPLGRRGHAVLTLFTRRPEGRIDRRELLAVRFVPLVQRRAEGGTGGSDTRRHRRTP